MRRCVVTEVRGKQVITASMGRRAVVSSARGKVSGMRMRVVPGGAGEGEEERWRMVILNCEGWERRAERMTEPREPVAPIRATEVIDMVVGVLVVVGGEVMLGAVDVGLGSLG